ncbi:MAG TPA: GntR family transcriptional regulator [Actinopolymorphaceae bacterium]
MNDLALPSLGGRPSLRDSVTRALRAALISGRMRPGTVYSAPALAMQLGVSATPVREAMLELAKQGLVETVRNKGFRVRELSDAELDEVTAVRELLEVPTVVSLVGTCEPSELRALRGQAADIVAAASDGDLIAYIEADMRFHLELLGLARNRHLVTIVEDLRARNRLYGLQSLSDRGVLVESAEEHLALLDLLVAGDRTAVEDLMRRHIGHVRGSWVGRAETPRP